MEIVLYYAPVTCALVPYVTLSEARTKFDVRPVDLRRKQQMSADYLKLNPKHKVPTVVVDGRALTENVAIQTWIARTFPSARLLPEDSWQQAQAVSVMAWCASGIHPHLSRINSPAKFCEGADAAAERGVRDSAIAQLFENFAVAEGMLTGRDYFFDHFTAADAHFFWCFRRATLFELDLSRFVHGLRHFERMKGRASVQSVLAYEARLTADRAAAAG